MSNGTNRNVIDDIILKYVIKSVTLCVLCSIISAFAVSYFYPKTEVNLDEETKKLLHKIIIKEIDTKNSQMVSKKQNLVDWANRTENDTTMSNRNIDIKRRINICDSLLLESKKYKDKNYFYSNISSCTKLINIIDIHSQSLIVD